MQLACSECDKSLENSQINMEHMQGYCNNCNLMVDIEPQIVLARKNAYRVDSVPGINYFSEEDTLELVINWNRKTGLSKFLLVFFALLWNGIIISVVFNSGGFHWFYIFHFLAGLVILYATIAAFVNKTYLYTNKTYFAKENRPLRGIPFTKNYFEVEDIEQFFVKEHVSKKDNTTAISYSLNILDKSGATKSILKGMDYAECLLTERLLENHLEIEDKHVPGEHIVN